MNTLIVYATQYGFTADCAASLKQQLNGEVTLVDLTKQAAPNPADFDAVIVGGSIYMGKVQSSITDFCADYERELLQKTLGLFLCCGLPKQIQQSMAASFPSSLIPHAKATGCFGGELRANRMKPMHKFIAGMMQKAGAKDGVEPPKANPQAIADFAAAMNAE